MNMSTVRRYLLGWPQLSRRPLNSVEHLLWIPQGGSRRTRVIYAGDQWHTVSEWRIDLLSAVIPLVHIRVQVDVGDELVEHRPRRLDHTIRELWAHTDRVSVVDFKDCS